MTEYATKVVLSYPMDLSQWGRDQVETSRFKAWLRKTREEVRPGDGWDEFVGVGCCGNSLDVPLAVVEVEGGEQMGPDTEIEFTVREACDLPGGWQVQSAAGPNAD